VTQTTYDPTIGFVNHVSFSYTLPVVKQQVPAATDSDLAREVVAHVLGFIHVMKDHAREVFTEFDLTPSQADALRNLGAPRSQRELALCLAFDASSVTDIVDRLEERGLVERQIDPTDRRIRRIVLTAKGHTFQTKLWARMLEGAPPIEALSAAEQRTLRDLLAKVVDPVELPR
jgi:DNA-binding MarR family transcriptional regulator